MALDRTIYNIFSTVYGNHVTTRRADDAGHVPFGQKALDDVGARVGRGAVGGRGEGQPS